MTELDQPAVFASATSSVMKRDARLTCLIALRHRADLPFLVQLSLSTKFALAVLKKNRAHNSDSLVTAFASSGFFQH